MDKGRRPVTPEEVPHLLALGALVRALRDELGLTQAQLGHLAHVTPGHLGAIERGERRTRASTIRRIVGAVVLDDERAETMAAELVEAAGPALGLEEDEAQRQRLIRRIERRTRRAEGKDRSTTIKNTQATIRTLRRMASAHERAGRDDAGIASMRRLADNFEADVERLSAKDEPSHEGSTGRAARAGSHGPAWHAWQDYARQVFGGKSGSLSADSAHAVRLAELKAAADAEEPHRGAR